IVQSFAPGVVQEIRVRDGQHVEQGELLIKLDPLEEEVDTTRLQKEHAIASTEAARLEAFLNFLGDPSLDVESHMNDADLPAAQRRQLLHEMQHHAAEMARLDGDKAQLRAKMQAIEAEIARLEALLPMANEHEAALHGLLRKKMVAKSHWSEAKQKSIDLRQRLIVERRRLDETRLALANKAKQKDALQTHAGKNAMAQLTEHQNRSEMAALNLRKAHSRQARNNLTAPVSGIVQQLTIHTIGGVVKAADPLLIIVPDDTQLIVEASVLNKDIGFVRVGQPAEIKLESFPFTKYGLLEGEVTHLSADAMQSDAQGLVYAMRASLNRNRILVGGQWTPLSPGMAATAEIKTGERAIIDFFLSPLRKSGQEAFKER
ncbi:MAG: HlyD family type I secretion periplasmic adaptor subunit, partial [Gammaproteobacteria bacterium]|nr:HlyD family type I secretion periplasmic adaptor subunit [Gammaproteobacteria bacterium]